MKKNDKREAKKDKNELIYAVLDLQAALSSLFAADSQNYYKPKWTIYNFTVYVSRRKDKEKKGSAEVGSCLMK